MNKWFNIGKGPVLDAARPLLDALQNQKEKGTISVYRIGDRRFEGHQRQIEIVFKSSEDANSFAF